MTTNRTANAAGAPTARPASSTTRGTRRRSPRRLARIGVLAAAAGLAVALAACGGDDSSASDTSASGSDAPVTTVAASDSSATTLAGSDGPVTTVGTLPHDTGLVACQLLDAPNVGELLGTPGVTAEPDTSLGAADGCRYSAARTDKPAVVLGSMPDTPYEKVKQLACDGFDPVTLDSGLLQCGSAVIAQAGSGALMVSVEDPTGNLDKPYILTEVTNQVLARL